MRAEAEGGPCGFVRDARCVMTRERTGGSDACDAGSLVCCHERRRREMLGDKLFRPGDALCCCFFIREFERLPVSCE